jgi:ParB-like chromosome segregation protein Spo0J
MEMNKHQPKIEEIKVDDLIPYATNSRTHSAEQVAQIAASMVEFGWTNPVLIDTRGTIVAGHGRVMAARKLGMETVPCIRLGHLSPGQVRAYVIADNKLAMNAGWDEELLASEIQSIMEAGEINVTLTGFNDAEIAEMLSGVSDPAGDGESKGLGTPIIHYDLIFETEEQQAKWFEFIRALKFKYPDHETIAERISAFIQANPVE